MSIFNKDFYPTPLQVIETMCDGIDLNGNVVLEPSAGSGNIVDYLQKKGAKVIACELSDQLRKIVATKCEVIESDFMNVKAEMISHVHYIVMNPPFSADERHIIHAFDIAPDGCTIIALCNARTVEMNTTIYRKRLSTYIKDYGKFVNLGSVFAESERNTDVEIGLVTLYKPSKSTSFEEFFDMTEEQFEAQAGIIGYNLLYDIVSRYRGIMLEFEKVLDCAVEINKLSEPFNIGSITFHCTDSERDEKRQNFKKELQKKAWDMIFNKANIMNLVTQKLRAQINKFVEEQHKVPFKLSNIYKMLELIVGTSASRMDMALEEAFDSITAHTEDNRFYYEGFKTNSYYLLKEKFIFHTYIKSTGNHIDRFGFFNNSFMEKFNDLVKAICYLTNTKWTYNYDLDSFYSRQNDGGQKQFGEEYEHKFFYIKMFKKGTIHCRFKDPELLNRFNAEIARIKGYPLYEHRQTSKNKSK